VRAVIRTNVGVSEVGLQSYRTSVSKETYLQGGRSQCN